VRTPHQGSNEVFVLGQVGFRESDPVLPAARAVLQNLDSGALQLGLCLV